MSYLCFRFH